MGYKAACFCYVRIMSENAFDAISALLRKIQDDLADFRRETEKRLERLEASLINVEPRLATLEDLARRQRRDTAGLLVMAKAVSGDFAEEIADLQKRVDRLEAQPS